MANQIKTIFNEFMKSRGLFDDAVCMSIKPILDKILNRDVSDILIVRNLTHGHLVIQMISSVWKYELIQRKAYLIEQINLRLEDYRINNIDFI